MEPVLLAGVASVFLVLLSKVIPNNLSRRRTLALDKYCCFKVAGICTIPVEISGNECLFKIVEKGLIGSLLIEGSICGLILVNKPVKTKKAIRKLESSIISLEVLYERYKMDKHKHQIDQLRHQLTEILRNNDPIEPYMLLLLCAKNDTPIDYLLRNIESRLEPYNCRFSLECDNQRLSFRQRKSVITSNRVLTNKIHTQLRQVFTLSRAYMYSGISIGTTLRGSRQVILPIIGREGTLHTCIVGPTGKGKSTVIAKIISRLNSRDLGYMNFFIIAVDPKGDLFTYLDQLYGNFEKRMIHDDSMYRELTLMEENKELVVYLLKGSSEDKQKTILEIIENTIESTKIVHNNRITLLAIDEAWMIPRTKILEKLLREGRSRNLSVFLASQYPGDLSDIVWSNIGNIIIFGSRSKKYLEHIRRYTGIDEKFLDEISKLETGEALLRYPWSSTPIMVRIL